MNWMAVLAGEQRVDLARCPLPSSNDRHPRTKPLRSAKPSTSATSIFSLLPSLPTMLAPDDAKRRFDL
jgi:hypothetical protein